MKCRKAELQKIFKDLKYNRYLMSNYIKSNSDDYNFIMNYSENNFPNVKFNNMMSRFDSMYSDVKICKSCLKPHIKKDIFCSRICKVEYSAFNRQQTNDRTNQKYKENGGVLCLACNEYCRHDIRQHLRREHKLDINEYKQKYNGEVMSQSRRDDIGKRMTGKNNPAYCHNGKYSSLSDNFIKYADLEYSDIITRKSKICSRISKSNKFNGNNNKTLTYWINRGYSENEARLKISESQQTFSLEKCIDKYGSELGLYRWKKRQEIWQETLNAKDPVEISKINQGRSTGRMCQLFLQNPNVKNISGVIYYARFFDKDTLKTLFWKIGITSRSGANARFGNLYRFGIDYEVIFEEKNMTFYEAFKKEQLILNENSIYRININHNGFKTTEAFSRDIMNEK